MDGEAFENSDEERQARLAERKAALRHEAIARRNAIPPEERARRSEALCEALLDELSGRLDADADANGRPTLAAYCALGSEVDLAALLHGAWDRGWRVCLPCMVQAQPAPRMLFLELDRAAYDARELPFLAKPARNLPADDPLLSRLPLVEPAQMDAVVVPMVAFDDRLERLGYGGGNYDRFLGRLRKDALVIGAAFEEQRVEEVPREPHDLPLPRILVA